MLLLLFWARVYKFAFDLDLADFITRNLEILLCPCFLNHGITNKLIYVCLLVYMCVYYLFSFSFFPLFFLARSIYIYFFGVILGPNAEL